MILDRSLNGGCSIDSSIGGLVSDPRLDGSSDSSLTSDLPDERSQKFMTSITIKFM